ncbi:hypothetical protein FRC08_014637 [Ceratobasidium sp. 394]|nr:hypothetical protein FRC08_014637 [Ceratobasidium sp. 394]
MHLDRSARSRSRRAHAAFRGAGVTTARCVYPKEWVAHAAGGDAAGEPCACGMAERGIARPGGAEHSNLSPATPTDLIVYTGLLPSITIAGPAMYAPHRAVPTAPADKPADECVPPLDDFGLLVRPAPLPAVRPTPAPAPVPVPPPALSAPPLSLTLPLVSDDFSADIEFARQLMLSDEQNLHPAALDSLRLEDVVPPRSHLGVKYAYAPSRARRAHHGHRSR